MSEISYQLAPLPVRADLVAAHQRAWKRLARPGTWWTGQQRIAIAAESRHAGSCALCRERKAALSPYGLQGLHDSLGALPENLVEVIHRIRTDPGRLMRKWQQGALAGGLSEEQYVETVAVVATTVAVDTFTRAIGMPQHPLPAPIEGEPSRKRPKGAKLSGAWVSWVMPQDATAEEDGLYLPGAPVPNIRKAMSLVPEEVTGFFDIAETQYMPASAAGDYSRAYRAITHTQIELVASRVSALNGCEY